MIKKPFSYGWGMVALAAMIPVIFSFSAEMSIDASSIKAIESGIFYNKITDKSYILSYIAFGTMHIMLCLAATYYTYDTVRNTSSVHIFSLFRKNHVSAFMAVTLVFVAATCIDSPLRKLSCDLLWIGLGRLSPEEMMFKEVGVIPLIGIRIKFFNFIPISLVVAAFAPASAIMMATPHLVEKVTIGADTTIDDITASFFNDFEIVYLLMVSLLISSSIATNMYLRTPYSTINEKISIEYSRLINSTFSMWCFIYFIVLLSVLLVSYALVSYRIGARLSDVRFVLEGKSIHGIRHAVNIHFLIKKNSSLFASSFSPVILLFIKNVIS